MHLLHFALHVTQMSRYAYQPGDSNCARQDQNARAGKFGFAVDNTIGGTPQPNGWVDDWAAFFRERRLLHQLRLANDAALSRMGERLAAHLGRFFEGIQARCHAVVFWLLYRVSTLVAPCLGRLPAAPAAPGQRYRAGPHR